MRFPTDRHPATVRLAAAGAVGLLLAGCSPQEGDGLVRWLEQTADKSPWYMILILAVATVTSEDLACVTAGVLVAKGIFDFTMATCGCLLGIVISDVGLFLIGKWWGDAVVRIPPISWWVTPKRLELGKSLYQKYGGGLIVTSRFLPGTRMMCYIAAGMLGYPWKRFVAYMSVACAVWTPVLIGFATLFGAAILSWFQAYQRWAFLGLIATILIVWLLLEVLLPLGSAEGRQALRAKWRRYFGR